MQVNQDITSWSLRVSWCFWHYKATRKADQNCANSELSMFLFDFPSFLVFFSLFFSFFLKKIKANISKWVVYLPLVLNAKSPLSFGKGVPSYPALCSLHCLCLLTAAPRHFKETMWPPRWRNSVWFLLAQKGTKCWRLHVTVSWHAGTGALCDWSEWNNPGTDIPQQYRRSSGEEAWEQEGKQVCPFLEI